MKVYGIPNCNTVKKGIDWLKKHQIEVDFHDFKKLGVTQQKLQDWCHQVGWERLVNKKGTTWRMLSPEVQASVQDENSAIKLMLEKHSVIKRPIIEHASGVILGFDEETYKVLMK